MSESQNKQNILSKWIDKIIAFYHYAADGVWNDPRNKISVRIVKTLNLTFGAFMDSSLQNKSMSLTYQTILSIVPAFALLVAVGRGFGLQDTITNELYQLFPAQSQGIATAMHFVDSYLKSTTQGVFVGVGIIILLWTIISLLSSIEDSFNAIWNVKQTRTMYQKITDYIAICIMLPVLLICQSGISFFMSDIVQQNLQLPFLTPLLNIVLGLIPLALCWLAFTLAYYLIPNTKVSFKYSAIAGILGALAFQILEYLFLNGQIYVSKYNAIYGSFAFLPLLLIWLQLSWLVLLTGCMVAYSMQNVFTFNLLGNKEKISNIGWRNVSIIVMTVCIKRFVNKQTPLSDSEIARQYYLPIRIVGDITSKLRVAGLIYTVELGDGLKGITPAVEPEYFSLADFMRKTDQVGITDFITDYQHIYSQLISVMEPLQEKSYNEFSHLLIKDLPLPTPETIKSIMIQEAKVK